MTKCVKFEEAVTCSTEIIPATINQCYVYRWSNLCSVLAKIVISHSYAFPSSLLCIFKTNNIRNIQKWFIEITSMLLRSYRCHGNIGQIITFINMHLKCEKYILKQHFGCKFAQIECDILSTEYDIGFLLCMCIRNPHSNITDMVAYS